MAGGTRSDCSLVILTRAPLIGFGLTLAPWLRHAPLALARCPALRRAHKAASAGRPESNLRSPTCPPATVVG